MYIWCLYATMILLPADHGLELELLYLPLLHRIFFFVFNDENHCKLHFRMPLPFGRCFFTSLFCCCFFSLQFNGDIYISVVLLSILYCYYFPTKKKEIQPTTKFKNLHPCIPMHVSHPSIHPIIYHYPYIVFYYHACLD